MLEWIPAFAGMTKSDAGIEVFPSRLCAFAVNIQLSGHGREAKPDNLKTSPQRRKERKGLQGTNGRHPGAGRDPGALCWNGFRPSPE
ncbi:MAG: hypothetical protein R6X15_02310 [Pseudomonadota bacterium]